MIFWAFEGSVIFLDLFSSVYSIPWVVTVVIDWLVTVVIDWCFLWVAVDWFLDLIEQLGMSAVMISLLYERL